MRILGIDPGLAITGYGLIETSGIVTKVIEAGIIRSDAKDMIEKRLAGMYKKIMNLLEELKPGVAVLEELYSHYKHPRTSILMGHARGIICLAVENSGIPLISYSATRVKKAVTGKGHASKQQIQRTIVNFLNLKTVPEPVDVTDALALAVTHANVNSHKILFGQSREGKYL
jgi:crossover junction endodeoxyribonuclease RuvC